MPAPTAKPHASLGRISAGRAGGRAARATAPRSAHGAWAPARERPDPVALLGRQDATRVADLVPIRYGRMLVSPLSFFRGAAAIMAADLAGSPDTGLAVQLCGDAHLSNFGVFAAPDRRLVFDVNDFDETLPGPWEWDVKRLAASVEVAARDRGFGDRRRHTAVRAAVRGYREAMRGLAGLGHLAVWYARLDAEEVVARLGGRGSDSAAVRRALGKARAKDSFRAMSKLTEHVDGRLRIRSDPPLIVPVGELRPGAGAEATEERIRTLLSDYQRSLDPERRHLIAGYRYVDMAHKVVGVGSVGSRAWIVLLEGRDSGDPLVLQAKEAQPSVLEEHLGPSAFANHGERVVRGQRFMQAAGDIFLGWQRVDGFDGVRRDFYLRQLWDGKGSADVATMSARTLTAYAGLCGRALARAHARTGDREAIAGYLGSGDRFDRAIAEFAAAYADQNECDYRALLQAVADGRVVVRAGL